MKGNFKRKHSCPQCQNKELNQTEWEKHLKRYKKKWFRDYQREWQKKNS